MKSDPKTVIIIPGPNHERQLNQARLLIKRIVERKIKEGSYPPKETKGD